MIYGSTQIPIWESIFIFPLVNIPNEIINLFLKLQFVDEGNTSKKYHLMKFWCKCIKHNITNLDSLFILLTQTFKGGLKRWLETFSTYSIFTCFQFVDEVLITFKEYDYRKLYNEL